MSAEHTDRWRSHRCPPDVDPPDAAMAGERRDGRCGRAGHVWHGRAQGCSSQWAMTAAVSSSARASASRQPCDSTSPGGNGPNAVSTAPETTMAPTSLAGAAAGAAPRSAHPRPGCAAAGSTWAVAPPGSCVASTSRQSTMPSWCAAYLRAAGTGRHTDVRRRRVVTARRVDDGRAPTRRCRAGICWRGTARCRCARPPAAAPWCASRSRRRADQRGGA